MGNTKKTRQPRRQQLQTTIGAAVGDAISEFDTLRDELDNWYSNMSENLQGGSKGDALQDAIGILENCNNEPDVPEALAEIEIEYTHDRRATSRSGRCGEAASMMSAAVSKLEDIINDNDDHGVDLDGYMTAEQEEQSSERETDMETLRDELQEIIDEVEGIEFPGMYG